MITYKNYLRRVVCAALSLCLALSCLALVGCGSDSRGDDGRLTIVTTIFPQYDFVRAIGGDRVSVRMLLPPDTEAHGFEPTLEDLADINACDAFIYVGGDSEHWVDDLLASMNGTDIRTLALIDTVTPLEVCAVGTHSDGHSHDHDHYIDEHIWTSPRNAVLMVAAICELMCELDPDNADFFRANAALYTAELQSLDAQLSQLVGGAKRRTLVFAERFPFRYLANDYGLTYHAAFEGCSSDTEPSLSTIAQLTAVITDQSIPVVFYIEFSKQTVADTLSEATGAKKLLLHSCHNLTSGELAAGETYLSLMNRNIENLREALY